MRSFFYLILAFHAAFLAISILRAVMPDALAGQLTSGNELGVSRFFLEILGQSISLLPSDCPAPWQRAAERYGS
jgi:hypothetical protein